MPIQQMTRYRTIHIVLACAVGGLLAHGAAQVFRSEPIETASADAAPPVPTNRQPEVRHTEAQHPRQYVEAILGRKLFPVAQDSAASPDIAQPGVRVEGGLNLSRKLNLIGTVQREHGGGVAIVEELASKKQGLFRLHERVFQIGELAGIQNERILIREGKQEEWLQSASPTLNTTSPSASGPAHAQGTR
jgi:hypothetical protein